MMTLTLAVSCVRCGRRIRSWRQLVLWCDRDRAMQAKQEYETWERQQEREAEEALARGGVQAWLKTVVRPLASVYHVEDVPWQVLHWRCVTDAEWERGYPIEGTRIDTPEKALVWTLHLQEKVWFAYTDWEGALRKLFCLPEV